MDLHHNSWTHPLGTKQGGNQQRKFRSNYSGYYTYITQQEVSSLPVASKKMSA
jgi:hypothetical protein